LLQLLVVDIFLSTVYVLSKTINCNTDMSKSEANLHIRIPINELRILENYAEKTKRTKTDLVREWIRSLKSRDCT